MIDCFPSSQSISNAITDSLNSHTKEKFKDISNPYGDGGASQRIINVLEKIDLNGLTKKKFHDLGSSKKTH